MAANGSPPRITSAKHPRVPDTPIKRHVKAKIDQVVSDFVSEAKDKVAGSPDQIMLFSLHPSIKAPPPYTYDRIGPIASGDFGSVYAITISTTPTTPTHLSTMSAALKINKRVLDTKKKLHWALAAAQRHGHLSMRATRVVRLHYCWVGAEQTLFQVMEKGTTSLAEFVQTYKEQIPPSLFRCLVMDMTKAVSEVHRAGLIHADVKPSNFIMFQRRVEEKESKTEKVEIMVKLGDFDMVRSTNPEKDGSQPDHPDEGDKDYLGKVDMQQGLTQASDIFALGVSIWKLLSHFHIDMARDYLDLIKMMTASQPKERLSIEECWKHLIQ